MKLDQHPAKHIQLPKIVKICKPFVILDTSIVKSVQHPAEHIQLLKIVKIHKPTVILKMKWFKDTNLCKTDKI